jgi:glutamine synthetase
MKRLEQETLAAEKNPAGRTQAVMFRDRVVPAMDELRRPIDRAEMIVDKDLWPVPSYADLMFEV